ncbi:hypothetical protein CPB84DRAFT_1846769 [Gymnopilus junonius]|uniref:Uncharacterized protein n=1 Tax=Gymnopilus junonius TaxID=109634 RepID=A0A9P5TNG4_GYMJU|nr:hypothetical protein CPB84DRAFT_1846769 [Gymnopilus junonius]
MHLASGLNSTTTRVSKPWKRKRSSKFPAPLFLVHSSAVTIPCSYKNTGGALDEAAHGAADIAAGAAASVGDAVGDAPHALDQMVKASEHG